MKHKITNGLEYIGEESWIEICYDEGKENYIAIVKNYTDYKFIFRDRKVLKQIISTLEWVYEQMELEEDDD